MVDEKKATLHVEVAGIEYELRQSRGLLTSSNSEGTTGAALWKISPLLAEWLQDTGNTIWKSGLLHQNSVLVELGCGITGLIGLVMAKRVAKYVLTDQRSVLKALQENVDANAHLLTTSGRRKPPRTHETINALMVAELNWETNEVSVLDDVLAGDKIGMIVISDCVFNDFLLQPLVDVCQRLCQKASGPETAILVAQQMRSDEVFTAFMEKLLQVFRVWRLPDNRLPEHLRSDSGFALHLAVLR